MKFTILIFYFSYTNTIYSGLRLMFYCLRHLPFHQPRAIFWRLGEQRSLLSNGHATTFTALNSLFGILKLLKFAFMNCGNTNSIVDPHPLFHLFCVLTHLLSYITTLLIVSEILVHSRNALQLVSHHRIGYCSTHHREASRETLG